MHRFLLIIFSLFTISSCHIFNGRKGDIKIARVHDKVLYKSDLDALISDGTNAADSTTIVQRYIENWVRHNIFLYEAEKNISLRMTDVQKKVDDYRNSLMIFTFENQFLNENLDTLISDEILIEYYEKHQVDFKLRNNIVKLNFVKVPIDAPDIGTVRRLISSSDSVDLAKLEEYCADYAAGYFLDQESWFVLNDIFNEVPLNPSNQEQFLRNNKMVELKDSQFTYFLYIRDFKLEGSLSPLVFQKENIKAIILNHRKQELINKLRQDLYMSAVKESAFELYQ